MNIKEGIKSVLSVSPLAPKDDKKPSEQQKKEKEKETIEEINTTDVAALRKKAKAFIISNPKCGELVCKVPKEFNDIDAMSKEELENLIDRLQYSANKTCDDAFSKTALTLTGNTISSFMKDDDKIIANRIVKNQALVDCTQQIIGTWLFNFSMYAKWVMLMSSEISVGMTELMIRNSLRDARKRKEIEENNRPKNNINSNNIDPIENNDNLVPRHPDPNHNSGEK